MLKEFSKEPVEVREIPYSQMTEYQLQKKEKDLRLCLCLNEYIGLKLAGIEVKTSGYCILYFSYSLKLHGELYNCGFEQVKDFVGLPVKFFDIQKDNKIILHFDKGSFPITSRYGYYIIEGTKL